MKVCRFRFPFAENKQKLSFPETWRHEGGYMETWRYRHEDMETWRNGDTETWRQDMEKRRHGDMDMQTWTCRHQTENGIPGDFP